eukprot:Amastigsp_a511559_34.p2 type:complete len:202 gc:universal Amastigsp_a511559_34:288-893(+)
MWLLSPGARGSATQTQQRAQARSPLPRSTKPRASTKAARLPTRSTSATRCSRCPARLRTPRRSSAAARRTRPSSASTRPQSTLRPCSQSIRPTPPQTRSSSGCEHSSSASCSAKKGSTSACSIEKRLRHSCKNDSDRLTRAAATAASVPRQAPTGSEHTLQAIIRRRRDASAAIVWPLCRCHRRSHPRELPTALRDAAAHA